MLLFGLGTGGLLVGAGLLTYWLAPKIGPNPIFGVRTGYSFANRAVWDKSNRIGGLLIAANGLLVVVVGFTGWLLGISQRAGISWLAGLMLVGILASTAWLFVYSRRLALAEIEVQKLRPVPFKWQNIVPVVVGLLVLFVLALILYPSMPVRMATHFGPTGAPDGWMSRNSFFASYLGIAVGLTLISLLVVFLARRDPVIGLSRWGKSFLLAPEEGVFVTSLFFGVLNLFLAAVLLDVGWFNTRGEHLISVPQILLLSGLMIVLVLVLFFRFAERKREA